MTNDDNDIKIITVIHKQCQLHYSASLNVRPGTSSPNGGMRISDSGIISKRQIKDARNKMRNPIEVPNKNAQALLDLHAPDSNPASDATDHLKSILKYVNTGLVSSQV